MKQIGFFVVLTLFFNGFSVCLACKTIDRLTADIWYEIGSFLDLDSYKSVRFCNRNIHSKTQFLLDKEIQINNVNASFLSCHHWVPLPNCEVLRKKKIEKVVLKNNCLKKDEMDLLSGIKCLALYNFSRSFMTQTIPKSLFFHALNDNLRVLIMSKCGLVDTDLYILSGLPLMENIRKLNLEYNNLQGDLKEILYSGKEIREIYLKNNNIEGLSLLYPNQINLLDISMNNFQEDSIDFLLQSKSFKKLRTLLVATNIRRISWDKIKVPASLEEIKYSYDILSVGMINDFFNSANMLKKISLTSFGPHTFSSKARFAFTYLDNLKVLQIHNMGLSDYNLSEFARVSPSFPNLKILDLNGNHIKGLIDKNMKSFMQLWFLDLTANPLESIEYIKSVFLCDIKHSPLHRSCVTF